MSDNIKNGIPFVEFDLDKVRKVRLGAGAMISIERRLGKPLSDINFGDDKVTETICECGKKATKIEKGEGMRFDDVCEILAAGMRHEDGEITAFKVSELIDNYCPNLTIAIEVVGKAIAAAYGSNSAEDKKDSDSVSQDPNA